MLRVNAVLRAWLSLLPSARLSTSRRMYSASSGNGFAQCWQMAAQARLGLRIEATQFVLYQPIAHEYTIEV